MPKSIDFIPTPKWFDEMYPNGKSISEKEHQANIEILNAITNFTERGKKIMTKQKIIVNAILKAGMITGRDKLTEMDAREFGKQVSRKELEFMFGHLEKKHAIDIHNRPDWKSNYHYRFMILMNFKKVIRSIR